MSDYSEAHLADIAQQLMIANIFTLQSGAVNGVRVEDDLVFDRDEYGDPVLKKWIAQSLGVIDG